MLKLVKYKRYSSKNYLIPYMYVHCTMNCTYIGEYTCGQCPPHLDGDGERCYDVVELGPCASNPCFNGVQCHKVIDTYIFYKYF